MRSYPGLGRLKGKVRFKYGNEPKPKEENVIEYKPAKESKEKSADKENED